jgi:RNA polymerase sigma-70 factor (ECF subfamily)
MNEAEFVAAYRDYLPNISMFLSRRVGFQEVEDLAAEIFAIAWRKRSQPIPGYELAWLYRIAANVVANHRRSQIRTLKLNTLFSFEDFAPSAEAIAVENVWIAQALSVLSHKDRSLITLVALDGLSVNESANLLGLTANAASLRLTRIRSKLAPLLAFAHERNGQPQTGDNHE